MLFERLLALLTPQGNSVTCEGEVLMVFMPLALLKRLGHVRWISGFLKESHVMQGFSYWKGLPNLLHQVQNIQVRRLLDQVLSET